MAAVAAQETKEIFEKQSKKECEQAGCEEPNGKRLIRETPEETKAKQTNNTVDAVAAGVLLTARGDNITTCVTPYLNNKMQARYKVWEREETKRQLMRANARAVEEARTAHA